jgi:hypothetical protein
LYLNLKQHNGWGSKTAALFTKIIYQIHNQYNNEYRIWDDIPIGIQKEDKLYLPVDAVILRIFEELDILLNNNYKTINFFLHKYFNNKNIEIWDDLWFWGFITQQNNKSKERIIKYNEAKLYALEGINKDKTTIKQIEKKANEFIKLIKD